jgi:hypothetical protein
MHGRDAGAERRGGVAAGRHRAVDHRIHARQGGQHRRVAGRVAAHVLVPAGRSPQVEHPHREPLAEQRQGQPAHVPGPAHVQHAHDGLFLPAAGLGVTGLVTRRAGKS